MRRLLALGLGCLASFTASSEDLLTIFDQAVVNDPTVREAEFTRKATREARPQAWAAYLPQINGSYNKGESRRHAAAPPMRKLIDGSRRSGRLRPAAVRGQQFVLSPRLRAGASSCARASSPGKGWSGSSNRRESPRRRMRTTASPSRIWRLRVSTRYFDVLAALDNVQAQQASLDAISRQLEQADKRFEVGLIAITDVQEARAARDTAAADLIAAKRQLATSQELLREITDMQYAVLSTPRGTMPLAVPEPADPQKWVEASMEQNLALTSSRLGAEIARDDVRTAFGGHLPHRRPGARQVAQRKRRHRRVSRPIPGLFAGGTAPPAQESDTDKSISLQVTVPIWSSGGTHSRVKQSSNTAGRPPSSASSAFRVKPSAPRATPISASCRKSRACRRSSRRWNRAAPRSRPPKRATTWAPAPRSTCWPRASSWSRPTRTTRAAATTTCSTCCASSSPRACSIARRSKT